MFLLEQAPRLTNSATGVAVVTGVAAASSLLLLVVVVGAAARQWIRL